LLGFTVWRGIFRLAEAPRKRAVAANSIKKSGLSPVCRQHCGLGVASFQPSEKYGTGFSGIQEIPEAAQK
jgi:hypothetical protein